MADNIVPDHQTYMQQLQDIWFGQWGSENRSPIHTAAGMLQDAFDTDITEELATISSATKGEDMRVAIHDALYKLDIAKPEPPAPPEDSVKISDLYSTDSYVEGDGVISPIRETNLTGSNEKWCCNISYMVASDSDGYVSVMPEEDGLALLFIAARPDVQPVVDPSDGWTLVVNAERTSSIGFGFDVYKKTATHDSRVSASIEKNTTYGAYCILCVEYGASGVSVIDDAKWTQSSFSPTPKTSSRRIYAAVAPNSSTYKYLTAVSFIDNDGIDLKRIEVGNQVFLAHDYQNDVNSTPDLIWGSNVTFSSGNVTSLTLDILEG